MTSKERVLTAIKHQEPDRVPVGEWGIDHDHVGRILGHHSYWRNRRDTTLALWEGRRDEIVESMKQDYAELIEKLDYDVVTVPLVPPKNSHPGPAPKQIDKDTWEDKEGRIYKYAASNDSIQCMTPSQGKEELTDEDIRRTLEKAAAMDDSVFELVDYFGDRYGKERAVLFRDMDIYGILLSPFGGDYMHQMIVLVTAEDDLMAIQEAGVIHNRLLTEHCAKHNVAIMMQGTDFCMNTGPIMSPQLLRNVFFPMMKTINIDIAKAGMHSFFHCCGNTTQIMDDFVEAGYEGYQSIQVSSGLNNAEIKKKYGNSLTMWTGVQCETLIEGSREDVKKEVTEGLETLMPGGGFIFGSTNSVQFGANTDNYLMALDIVREKGRY
jgi:uroporphyrinogen decarboxylase